MKYKAIFNIKMERKMRSEIRSKHFTFTLFQNISLSQIRGKNNKNLLVYIETKMNKNRRYGKR
jgi:hypothetical protein